MKILFITPKYVPEIGGVQKHVSYIAKELVKNNKKVSVITSTYQQKIILNKHQNEIQVYPILLNAPNQNRCIIFFNLLKVWCFLLKKIRLLLNHNIIHLHDYQTFLWLLPYIHLLKILFNKQIFITFHGFESYPIPRFAKLIRKVAEISVNGNICVGSFIPKWYGTNPDFVIIGGVDKVICPSKLPDNEIAIFIGRLTDDTGILHYIDALRILKEKHRINIVLNICGDGPLKLKIKELKRIHDINIIFHGLIPNPEYLLVSSRYAFVSSYLAILEAMSNKRPVFSIYSNDMKRDYLYSIPNAEKMMFIAASSEELSEQLYEIILNPEKITSIIDQAYEFTQNLYWGTLGETYLKLYDKRKHN